VAPTAPPPLPSDVALFLDVDGTLVELAPTPDEARAAPQVPALLERLRQRLGGAVALVSGRSIATLDRMLHPAVLPAVGVHGLEWRTAHGQTHRRANAAGALAAARDQLQVFVTAHGGVLLEDKGLTVALHYRARPDLGTEARSVAERVALDSGGRLELLEGKCMLELKPPGTDKGGGIRQLLRDPPFAGRRPVFVGDDVTDEAGFGAVNALGGISVVVDLDRASAATYRLADVTAVLRWLAGVEQRPT